MEILVTKERKFWPVLEFFAKTKILSKLENFAKKHEIFAKTGIFLTKNTKFLRKLEFCQKKEEIFAKTGILPKKEEIFAKTGIFLKNRCRYLRPDHVMARFCIYL